MVSDSKTDSIVRKLFGTFSVLLVLVIICQGQEDDPEYIKIQSELELIQWDLQDECTDMAHNVKKFYMKEPTGLRDKIKSEVDHANFLRTHANRLKQYSDVPYDLQRNWTYFTKCGDVLLTEDEYKALNVFANKNLELKLNDKIETVANKTLLNEQEVSDAFVTCRNKSQLEDIWIKWENGVKPFKEWYGDALKLTNKAAIANDCVNVENYWELLTDIPSGYELGRNLYESIKPLYEKLTNFVRLRINKHYNTTFEEHLPGYFLGSFLADDWSYIADIILPNPQLYHDIRVELQAREISNFYKYAGNFTKNLGFGDLTNEEFFKRSVFSAESCDTKILDNCAEQYSSILTCNHTTLSEYFDAFETVMHMGLTKVNFHARVRQMLRFSPVLEAMSSMSSLLSINSMLQYKILDKNVFSDEVKREDNRMTVMLLLALRILPKIAYYHAMDEFRLEWLGLENQDDVEAVFHEYRQKVQKIETPPTQTSEFLRDEHILYNRPYLSKLLAQFLQFQLIDYYQIDLFEDGDISTLFNKDTTFRDFILNIPNRDSEDLLSFYYNIDEISEYPLQSFFSPLEEYLDNAPLEQVPFTLKKAKYVKPASTTPAPKTKKPKTKPNSKINTNVKTISNKTQTESDSGNLQRKLPNQNLIRHVESAITSNSSDENARLDRNQAPVASAKTPIGIYIGAAIVVITLGIIGGGFIAQRRRTQRNNRRYNA